MAKILIIEDESLHREGLEHGLRARGFDVVGAGNGEDGLRMAKEADISLVVLDLLLPKKSGFAFLDELRADPKTKDMPVLVLTALGDDASRKRAEKFGVEHYFVKTDWQLSELVNKISEIASSLKSR